jgi:hypothetical protein
MWSVGPPGGDIGLGQTPLMRNGANFWWSSERRSGGHRIGGPDQRFENPVTAFAEMADPIR